MILVLETSNVALEQTSFSGYLEAVSAGLSAAEIGFFHVEVDTCQSLM